MGDNLPQELYEAWQRSRGVDPDVVFNRWNNQPYEDRQAWEAVAKKAREELGLQFRRDMRDARDEYGAAGALANLLDPEGSAK